jgi:hypothetical protein
MGEKCALCGAESALLLSHIIPKFVFDWQKRTSPTYVRRTDNPNRRVQDGQKNRLLCEGCEEMLSKWEGEFAKNVFAPLHEQDMPRPSFNYREWALKFVVSVSWRVLTYMEQSEGLISARPDRIPVAHEALGTWKEFLLGKRPHPDRFEQHVLIGTNFARSMYGQMQLSPYINRYIDRSVDMDLAFGKQQMYVYTKMGRLILFGFVDVAHPQNWEGTKIHVHKGQIGGLKYVLPPNIGTYINDRANITAARFGFVSGRQRAKIHEAVEADPEAFANSELFDALSRDYEMFGDAAFQDPRVD